MTSVLPTDVTAQALDAALDAFREQLREFRDYGGSSPRVREAVAVNLRRMNRVLEIDGDAVCAVVEPAVGSSISSRRCAPRGTGCGSPFRTLAGAA